jgi:hypothetical protein
MRPICCNYNCEKPVTVQTGRIADKLPRWRPVCGHCQGASYGKHPYAKDVVPFVTGICSNKDSHLGFKCWTNFKKIPKDFKGRTQIDHIDGNPSNNLLDNLDELCVACHSYKGQRNGDYNGWRSRSNK